MRQKQVIITNIDKIVNIKTIENLQTSTKNSVTKFDILKISTISNKKWSDIDVRQGHFGHVFRFPSFCFLE